MLVTLWGLTVKFPKNSYILTLNFKELYCKSGQMYILKTLRNLKLTLSST